MAPVMQWFASCEFAFTAFGEATCLLDFGGTVMHASTSARRFLERHTELRLRDNRLWHPLPGIRGLIIAALTRVIQSDVGVTVQLPVQHGASCLDLAMATLHDGDLPTVLVARVRCPRHAESNALEAMCVALGITAAERRVYAALLAGDTPTSYAKANRVSLNTVRTQIRLLLEKTGCTRQLDLVRMAMSVNHQSNTFT